MANTLRPLGRAWQPLLGAATDALARSGVALGALWPTSLERRAALERLGQLLDLVVTWNARIDLTAARSERELVDLYLADALVLGAHGAAERTVPHQRWVDVGSGAGAPGLALGLLWLAPQLTLVEPRRKRVAFLRTASGHFSAVRPARIVDGRSDEVPASSHDVAVSRATFSPADWLAEGARLAQSSVWVLLARAEPPELAGWRLTRQIDYEWPLTQAPRSALVFTREVPTAAA
jgi:16S rRNA (guanine527-N7)-methyltransferase